jgi:hypothetical protein
MKRQRTSMEGTIEGDLLMKKGLLVISMVVVLGLVANMAFTDETVPFPFWQHGWAIMSFWSITNVAGGTDAVVTVNMLAADGVLHASTTGTVISGQAWQISSAEAWYDDTGAGDGAGFGTYEIATTADTIYLWGAVYADLGTSQPGYTIILPGNPYGSGL